MQFDMSITHESSKREMFAYIMELEDEVLKLRRTRRVHRKQLKEMNRILENRQLRMARNYAEDRALRAAGYKIHAVG